MQSHAHARATQHVTYGHTPHHRDTTTCPFLLHCFALAHRHLHTPSKPAEPALPAARRSERQAATSAPTRHASSSGSSSSCCCCWGPQEPTQMPVATTAGTHPAIAIIRIHQGPTSEGCNCGTPCCHARLLLTLLLRLKRVQLIPALHFDSCCTLQFHRQAAC